MQNDCVPSAREHSTLLLADFTAARQSSVRGSYRYKERGIQTCAFKYIKGLGLQMCLAESRLPSYRVMVGKKKPVYAKFVKTNCLTWNRCGSGKKQRLVLRAGRATPGTPQRVERRPNNPEQLQPATVLTVIKQLWNHCVHSATHL